jgi:hypothetical protein
VINYRSQGLAEKICKTHQIVLAKRTKYRVRSIKRLGGLYVWKVGFPLGFSVDWPDTRLDQKITWSFRGLNVKQRVIFFLWTDTHREVMAYRSSWVFQSPGLQAGRGSTKVQNGGRMTRGSRWCAYWQQTTTVVAGFRRRPRCRRSTWWSDSKVVAAL